LTVLNSVLRAHPQNAVARYYAGNILAGKYCLDEARTMWRESIALDARNPLAQRNFGLMQSKILKDGPAATAAYQQAIAAAPDDIRLYAELDAVYRQFSIAGLTQRENIIMGLEKGADNALITSAAEVFNRQMMYELTLELLEQHSVDVWENGYYIHDLFSDAHIGNGLVDYDKRRYKESLEHFQAAMTYPENLGVGKPQKEQMANAKYYAARALRALRKRDEAQTWYESAVAEELDVLSPLKYYQGLAHRAMGHNGLAETRFREMIEAAKSEAAEQSGLAPLLEGLGYNGLGASKQSQEALSKFLQSTRPGHTSAQLRRLRYRFLPLAERLQDK